MASVLEKELMARAKEWRAAGYETAVAVVAETWGSAPRPRGARLIVRDDGEFMGSVSGGCVEGEVITAAAEVLQTRRPRILKFGVSDETAWAAGLSCGGKITVWLHPLRAENFRVADAVAGALAKRESGVCLTRAGDGAQQTDAAADELFSAQIAKHARRLAADKPTPQIMTLADESFFVEPFSPPPRLLVVGATHVTQALLPMAEALGFAAVVIDPRAAWASAARFPDADLRRAWPDKALAELNVGEHDAVVALTHDPKIDDPALEFALNAAPFYVGALGARKTHAKRLERLRQKGTAEAALARISSPVGLDIGAMNTAEIALSIVAEVVQTRRLGGRARHAGIAAVLLAAGESKRFGERNKLLSEQNGAPLLSCAAKTLQAARRAGKIRRIVAVVGHDADKTTALLARADIASVHNPDYQSGIASSLRKGLAVVEDEADAALIFLADMPAVAADDIAALVDAFADENTDIVVPTHGGKRGNPVLLARSQFARAMRLQGDAGARAFFAEAKTLEVEVGKGVLLDIDKPTDENTP